MSYRKKKCSIYECNNRAYYKDENNIKYCKIHSNDNMINVKYTKNCCIENCTTYASYKYLDNYYCKQHKIKDSKHVCAKVCSYLNCNKQPSFNFPQYLGVGIRCKTHIIDGMIDVKKKYCCIENCLKSAFHKKEMLCRKHSKEIYEIFINYIEENI